MTRDWFESNLILPEHQELPVRQVYVWLATTDERIVIIRLENGNWQFPGGKPEPDDDTLEATAIREVAEETGLDISEQKDELDFFGYYVITGDRYSPDPYLQVRYLLKLKTLSTELKFNIAEPEQDNKVLEAHALTIPEAYERITWLSETEELKRFRELAQIH
jgi:8-oxo-dGTP pyrophosphatase MutT (NUDIX family)